MSWNFMKPICNGGRRLKIADNSALLPSDVIDFCSVARSAIFAGNSFIDPEYSTHFVIHHQKPSDLIHLMPSIEFCQKIDWRSSLVAIYSSSKSYFFISYHHHRHLHFCMLLHVFG